MGFIFGLVSPSSETGAFNRGVIDMSHTQILACLVQATEKAETTEITIHTEKSSDAIQCQIRVIQAADKTTTK